MQLAAPVGVLKLSTPCTTRPDVIPVVPESESSSGTTTPAAGLRVWVANACDAVDSRMVTLSENGAPQKVRASAWDAVDSAGPLG